MLIHPSAIIDFKAQLDSSVSVAANAVIGANVCIDANTQIGIGAVIDGYTTIGKSNQIFSHAVIGSAPQDKKYAGEPTQLVIGDNNTFRECVTINTGTVQDKGITTIGSNNWVMAYVHIAHDCIIGHHTIIANATQLAGHVEVGDWAILGGMTAVHQFCRVGAHAMTGAGTVVLQDIPPFVMAQGYPATPHGLNSEGLKRRGFNSDDLLWLKRAYKLIYREGLSLKQAQEALQTLLTQLNNDTTAEHLDKTVNHLNRFIQFLDTAGRGLIR